MDKYIIFIPVVILLPLHHLACTLLPPTQVSQGAFKESSYLLFVSKCLSMNWRVRGLYCRTYNILREHWAHPFTNVSQGLLPLLLLPPLLPLPPTPGPSPDRLHPGHPHHYGHPLVRAGGRHAGGGVPYKETIYTGGHQAPLTRTFTPNCCPGDPQADSELAQPRVLG